MTNTPLITVGIICYNVQNNVKSLIDNIRQQTWENFEIVVVDDHSSDLTWNILQEMAAEQEQKSTKKIHIHRNEKNCGAGLSRKRIIEESHGEYIVFFDDDDISLPERIKEQYKRIESYKSQTGVTTPVICHTSRTVRHTGNQEFYVPAMGCDSGIAPHGKDVLQCILMGDKKAVNSFGSIGSGLLMASKKDFLAAGNFDSDYRRAQDVELAIRWAKMDAHFVGVAEPLMIQNMIITTRKLDLEEKYVLMFLEKHRDFLDERGCYNFITCWIKAKYAYLSGKRWAFLSHMSRAFFYNTPLFIQKARSATAGIKLNTMIKDKYRSLSKTQAQL